MKKSPISRGSEPSLVAQWWNVLLHCRGHSRRGWFDPWVERPPGGGNGNALQYSCRENPVDRGAWQVTVHGVVKSWTQLRWLTTHTHWRQHSEKTVNNDLKSLTHPLAQLQISRLSSLVSEPPHILPIDCHNHRYYDLEPKEPNLYLLEVSHAWLFITPWTIARQAPLSMGVFRQEYWSGLPCPPPGDLPDPGIEPGSPALQEDSLASESPGKSTNWRLKHIYLCRYLGSIPGSGRSPGGGPGNPL